MKTIQGKKRQNDQTRLFKLKCKLLKMSINVQTEFAAETHLAVGTTGRKNSDVPSRNTQTDCFEDRRAEFSTSKDIY
jgi:hypothetical protein